MTAALRYPSLLFAAGVEHLRRLPGAARVGPSLRLLPRILLGTAWRIRAWPPGPE